MLFDFPWPSHKHYFNKDTHMHHLQLYIFLISTSKSKEYQEPDPNDGRRKKNRVNLESKYKEVEGAYLPKNDIALLTNETHRLKRETSKQYYLMNKVDVSDISISVLNMLNAQ